MVKILNIFFIVLIIWWIYKTQKTSGLRKYFFPTLIIKLLAGVGVGLLYFYHYGYGDTIGYHQDAILLSDLFLKDFSAYFKVLAGSAEENSQFIYSNQPRAFFLVKLLSLVHLLTGQNYWLSGVYFSLFSFVGFWALANSLVKYFPSNRLGILIALLFFPSVVFWSSGIIKESIAMGALMMLIKLLIDWLFTHKISWKRIALSFILLFLVWQLKYYYLGVFLIAVIPLTITEKIRKTNRFTLNKYAVYGVLVIILVGLISLLHPNFHLSNIFQVIVDNHDLYVISSRPDQLIRYLDLQPNIWSIGYYFPLAIWSGFFRMGIWEVNQPIEYLIGIENFVLLIFAIGALFQVWYLKKSRYNLLIISAILYVALLTGFLAMSAPNLGTLARYRVGFLPVLVLLVSSNNPLLNYLKSKFSVKVEDISE
jgi:hypothetical protein